MPQLSVLQPPPFGSPVTDQSGFMTQVWQKYFQALYQRTGGAVALPNIAIGNNSTPVINNPVNPSNTTLYVSPTGVTTVLDTFVVTNTDSVAHPISVYIVPPGSMPSASNQIITNLSMPPKQDTTISTLVSQVVGSGQSIIAITDALSCLKVAASGRQVS